MESIDREYYQGLIIEWKERALRAEAELSAINAKLHAELRHPMRELTGQEEKIVEQALRDSGQIILHDPTTGPCPTCGFQVKQMGRAKPIVIEED